MLFHLPERHAEGDLSGVVFCYQSQNMQRSSCNYPDSGSETVEYL